MILCCAVSVHAQNFYDSFIASQNVEIIQGKVPAYFTPTNEDIARELQHTVTKAVDYYEALTKSDFRVKLAVLDSVQWPHERVPFGYVFYSSGWIFMNTGMSYDNFKKIYGLEDLYMQMDQELAHAGITSAEMISSFYEVYAIHELGHYFISQISNARSPDKWTNEFIATYFAFNFFMDDDESALTAFELFHRVHMNLYQPVHATIEDFNSIYMRMGVENYLWYHSNFYFLVEALYDCYGPKFLFEYEQKFPKQSDDQHSTAQIIQWLDRGCNEAVASWVNALESRTKN
ncbi:MAG: hypothetical protein R3301_03885 [Saprospiraceae bacterium]|nr:hypothetical protein [Saprospiraceae bacterium]